MSEHRSLTETAADTETLSAAHSLGRSPSLRAPDQLARGANLGRYLVLEKIGRGGMGVVYAGYDPELDRRVALKVLAIAKHETGQKATRRLREARALARLNHPNVLAVYDVGVTQGLLFIATELVEGETLAAWLKQPRGTQEILSMFRLAGQGLVAAHAEGLVHRDFKPANVMIGVDGRVRVVDFGLARDLASARDASAVVDVEALNDPGVGARLAHGGLATSLVGGAQGTPLYMAPEQRAGGSVGPAADQFSFCVSLFRALFGVFPPECGETEVGRDEAEAVGERLARAVPAGLRAALKTGLAEDPHRRHPSMEALLAVLTPSPWRGRRLLVATVLLLLLGLAGYRLGSAERQACEAGADRVAEVWNAASRERLQQTFAASPHDYVADAWPAIARALDAYGEAWAMGYRQACTARRAGTQSLELFDLRGACLDRRLLELAALLRVLSTRADARLDRALEAVGRLAPVSECAEVRSLRSPLPVPPPSDGRFLAMKRDLADVRALLMSGVYAEGQTRAEALVAAAHDFGYWPHTAEALLYQGWLADVQFEVEAAEEALIEALLAAQAGRHERVAAQAYLRLARTIGLKQHDLPQANRLADQARSVIERLGEPPNLVSDHQDLMGTLLTQEARYDEAHERLRRALELRTVALGEDHPLIANTLIRLGNADMARGELEAARDSFARALAISRRARGSWHPFTASGYARLGTASFELADYAQALANHRRALDIRRRSLGPDHVRVAVSLSEVANVLTVQKRYPEALERFRAALAVFEETLGPSHGHVATALSNLATALLDQGYPDQAREHFARALEIREQIYGADQDVVAETLYNLGETELRMAGYDRASHHFRRSHAIWEAIHGGDHFLIADAQTGIARALVGAGAPEEALPLLETALARRPETSRDPVFVAKTQFALARALQAAGREPMRALELARAARDNFLRTEKSSRFEIDEVNTWLAEYG